MFIIVFVWFWCTFIWLLYDFYGLTYWPSAQCQLLFSACFWFSRKSISNEVQMQLNFLMIFSGRKQIQEASGEQQKTQRGPTSHLGTPTPLGAPWCLVGPLWPLFAWFQRQKFLYIQKPPKITLELRLRRREPLYLHDLIYNPYPAPCRRGNHHRRPSSSSRRSPWRGGSSSPSGLRVCTSSYVLDLPLSLSCSWFGTILMYHELC